MKKIHQLFCAKSKTTKYLGAVKLSTKTQLFSFNTYYRVIFRLFLKREMEKNKKFGCLHRKKYGPFKKENSNICKIRKCSKVVRKIFRKEVKHFWFSVIVFEYKFIRQYGKQQSHNQFPLTYLSKMNGKVKGGYQGGKLFSTFFGKCLISSKFGCPTFISPVKGSRLKPIDNRHCLFAYAPIFLEGYRI